MIAPREIVDALIEAELISPADVVLGDLAVRNISRSNSVYAVSLGTHQYVVKGPLPARTPEDGSPELEQAFYARIAGDAELRSSVPAPRLLASVDGLLVLERVGSGETLEEYGRHSGSHAYCMVMLGVALGEWRRVSERFVDGDLPDSSPWVLRSLEPEPPTVVAQNAGVAQLAQSLRADERVRDGLERLRGDWRPEAAIHGDVRWDNAVVGRDPATGRERVLLVDWEYLGLGDPGWDVAGAVAEAIALESGSELALEGPEQQPDPFDLPALTAAVEGPLASFASAYRRAFPAAATDDLEAGGRLAPARVLQIAFLHAAWSPSGDLRSARALAEVAAALFVHPGALGALTDERSTALRFASAAAP